ncbi:MAG: cell envelope integrity protein TolA [Gammaproteobacteria bacterium]|nr:cell envelope integrity protein TolA [Gammaproteobacteria bacterium]
MNKFHPMAILLKAEGYPPAVIASVLMHACLLVFIFGRSVESSNFVAIEDPVIMTASAIDINPQRLRRLKRLELERLADSRSREEAEARERERERERELQQQAQRERDAQERQLQEETERLRQEDLNRQREEAARQQLAEETRSREEEARLQELERMAREQSDRDAQANQLVGEQLIIAEYATIIRRTISQNWQIPPSARNGMTAVVQLQIVPTGEVVGAIIVENSGNSAFDRSALQAVERVERFPELQDLQIGVFERNFRTFSLLFRPEDLLR